MTKEEAIRLAETKFWEDLTPAQITAFQLSEEKLCMPFEVFHGAVEETLGRPVWTHEFAHPENLKAELNGDPAPTMEEILALIPSEKLLVIEVEPKEDWK